MTELKEQLENMKTELANSKSLSDSLKQELEQVRERERETERERQRERERDVHRRRNQEVGYSSLPPQISSSDIMDSPDLPIFMTVTSRYSQYTYLV